MCNKPDDKLLEDEPLLYLATLTVTRKIRRTNPAVLTAVEFRYNKRFMTKKT